MAEEPPTTSLSPPPTRASAESCFSDSAIDMEMNSSTISPQSKPQYESEVDIASDSPADSILEPLAESSNQHKSSNQTTETVHYNLDSTEAASKAVETTCPTDPSVESQLPINTDPEPASHSELISHLSTTVSSLRLRHAEQSHLHTLFTSKLEALAQRSLEHEATIHSLTSELRSLRETNHQLSLDNGILAHENESLRQEMQDLRFELVERERGMEAMTGAVRGLEGWIESAGNSPRSNPQGAREVRVLQQQQQEQQDRAREHSRSLAGGGVGRGGRGGKTREVVRGKGRFRGRYYFDDDDHEATTDTTNDGLGGVNGSTDTVEIQEGVMAWVRGFRDVEEGLKARSSDSSHGRNRRRGIGQGQMKGRQAVVDPRRSNDTTTTTTDMFDEEFGDFETG